jgi:Phosphotransferase enzyme family
MPRTGPSMATATPLLTPRPVAASVDELLPEGASRRPFHPGDARSGTRFESVVVDGQRFVLKHVHLDDDFTMRVSGDLGCRPLRVWEAGLCDAAADAIDHAIVAAARGDGRNGWGAALLLRDVGDELVPMGDEPLPPEQHAAFLDHLAALSARLWGWQDELGLLSHAARWQWFNPRHLATEEALGWPEAVPRIAAGGWARFATQVPAAVHDLVQGVFADPLALSTAVRSTPQTFVHGDWKLGNLGTAADGRTVLLDWAYPGEGPVCHELAWYLALNRSRLPAGETKESTMDALRTALERHGVETGPWWERQLGLCLLGALVQFGWEKALGDEAELAWWCDRAWEGARFL